jgi:hypothetical protein
VRLRLHGTPAEVAAALPLLRACFEVAEVSRPYADRPPSRLVRVDLDLQPPTTTTTTPDAPEDAD